MIGYTLITFTFFVLSTLALPPPHLEYDVVNRAYNLKRQERGLPQQDLPNNFLLRKSTVNKRDELTLQQKINIAFLICGGQNREKYFYRDIMTHWPQTWLEDAEDMTFVMKFYADFDGDEQFTDLFFIQSGQFNATLDCNQQRGCVYVNDRYTVNEIPSQNLTYITEDTAVFVFQRYASPNGYVASLCGFDSALEGTGINGAGDVKYPIFTNILNPIGMMTSDVFSTATNAFDGGVGSNAYTYGIKVDENGTATNEMTIYSTFAIFNPSDPLQKIFLFGQQTTSYSLPIPVPPV